MPVGPTNNRDATDPLAVDQAPVEDSPIPAGTPGARWSTPLIGRERDLVWLQQAVLAREHRLLTITGPDGIGKTRLAASLVERVWQAFPSRIAYVPLGNVTSREIAVWSIAESLGVSGQADQPIERELHRQVGGERLLIVLDDLDQIPDLPIFLEQLLDAADAATVVVANEVALGIDHEVEHALQPLAVGDGTGHNDAVSLLLRRRGVDSTSSTSSEVIQDVARRLAGMPLALELVGAHGDEALASFARDTPAFPPPQTHPDTRSTLIHAVASAVSWSYARLAPPLQLALRQLSVFAAGFQLEAADAILSSVPGGPLDASAVLDRLASLSLLVRVVYEDGQTRFWMPTVIRTFAHARLEDAGEAPDACQRHAEWCLDYSEQAERALKGPEQSVWRQRVAREISNIRSALEWLYGSGQASSALWIATALGRFWSAGAHMAEGRYWLERGIARDAEVIDLARARALDTLSWLVLLQGDISSSRAMVMEALALFRRLGDVEGIAITLDSAGEMDLTEGNYRSAIAHLDEGQRHWREIGNRWSMAMSLITLGTATLNAGQRERSRESLMRAQMIMRDVGDERGLGLATLNLSWLLLHQREMERVAPLLRDALGRLRAHGGALETAEALEAIAVYALERGNHGDAARLYELARTLRPDAGIQPTFLSRLGHLDDRRHYRQRIDGLIATSTSDNGIAPRPLSDTFDIVERVLSSGEPSTVSSTATTVELTPRERDVLRLLVEELSMTEIAERLGISLRMATTIASGLYSRLGVNGRSHVGAAARRLGLIEPPVG